MPRLLFFSLSTICGYNSRAATKRGRRLFLSLEQVVKLRNTTITWLKNNRELPVLSTSPLLAVRLFLTLPRRRRGLRRSLCHRRPVSEPQKEGWQYFCNASLATPPDFRQWILASSVPSTQAEIPHIRTGEWCRGTILLNCTCVINTNAPRGHEYT